MSKSLLSLYQQLSVKVFMIFYIPLFLTILRIFLTPVFLVLLFASKDYLWQAVLVFSVAALTDFADGYYARKYNVTTSTGSFLDPLADKILILSTFLSFSLLKIVDFRVVLLIILRDIAVTVLRTSMMQEGVVMQTSSQAKNKTVFQFFSIYLVFIYMFAESWLADSTITFVLKLFVDCAMYFVAVFSVWSGILYFLENKEFLYDVFSKKGKNDDESK
jgi:CDP-diacylglycerol---glycerol-3-phosphate 3-phosphatidyltransferase